MTQENTDYDLVVIGAGSGGVRAARIAASLNARVAIIEERFYGGTCVNVGCVPKKMFSYAADFAEQQALAPDFGFQTSPLEFDWHTLKSHKDKEINRLNGIYQNLLTRAGVEIIDGHGKIVAPGKVEVAGQTLTASHILIATGGKPHVPDCDFKSHIAISDALFYQDTLPRQAIVVGGGYIACEFASILNGLGVDTTLVYRGELFLRGFDQDIRHFVAAQMQANGVNMLFNTDVTDIQPQGEGYQVHLSSQAEPKPCDKVFYATGRVANTDQLWADDLPIALSQKGFIRVDEHYQTSVPGVYALGDVIGHIQLTPVALAEGMWLARHLFADEAPAPVDYQHIATAVFCHPNIGTIGLTEEEALEQVEAVRIFKSEFRPLKYTLGKSHHRTLMKLVVNAETDAIMGLHMAGDEAGEVVQGFAVAIKAGATKQDFDRTIGIHPTTAEEFVTLRDGELHYRSG